ncbi:protein FAR1-related sequence 12-like [Rhizophagus clarus]|uniref:Protein FAR1-related sequence 12-like n=1 Tax=Rhizophagus clarus TaxID=94130 RepID=A0A8H3KYT0_9GLOM|nr:protein FAR1-related sequence 12-like [Rhizophagus clarus]
MYLSVFMIKNNYGKFCNVANVLVEDEIVSTYIWILQCLIKATNNITPKAFCTDSEPGLINTTAHVFPTTPYFYCFFHIWQNITKHLKTELVNVKTANDNFIENIIDEPQITLASLLNNIETSNIIKI